MSEEKKPQEKTERYELPKRIDRLEKNVRELSKQIREQRRTMRNAFQLMASQAGSTFGQGNLAAGFKAIAEGLKDE